MSVEPQKRAQIPLRMPPEVRHAVQVYADGHGISVNAALLHLVDRGLALEIAYHRAMSGQMDRGAALYSAYDRGTDMIKGEDYGDETGPGPV